MHVAVCDDKVADRKQMERLLARESDARLSTTGNLYIDSFGSAESILHAPMLYDVFFVDMHLPHCNGIDMTHLLRKAGVTAPIILCCGEIDYREAMLHLPEDYNFDPEGILFMDKPIKKEELTAMIDQAIQIKSQVIKTLEFRDEKHTFYFGEDDLMYGYTDGKYVHLGLADGTSTSILMNFQSIYSLIACYTHLEVISKTAFINVKYLRKVSLFKAQMTDGTSFKIGKDGKAYIEKALKLLESEC